MLDWKKFSWYYINKLAAEITTAISQHWKSFDVFDEILITGGGATVLGKTLEKMIPGAIVLENPQTVNAEGFFKYGKFIAGDSEDGE